MTRKSLRCPDGVVRQADVYESTKNVSVRIRKNGRRMRVLGKTIFGKQFKPTGEGVNGNPFA